MIEERGMNFDGNTPQNRESELSECQGESLGSRFAKRKVTDLKDSDIPWIGEIPKDWETLQLKRCVSFNNGQDYKQIETSKEEGFPVYGSGGVFAFAKNYIYNGEAVLFGRKGTIDKPLYVNEKFWAVDTMYFAISKNNCLNKFIYYLANIIPYDKYSTSTALPSMTQTILGNILIGVPSLQEQKAIAEFLDRKCREIDELVALQDKMIEELKAYKQSIITETVTKGLNPNVPLKDSGIEWIGEIPQHWKVVRLGAIGSTINGISKDASSFGEGFPFVSYKDVYNHYNLPNTVNGLVKSNENEQKVFSVNYGDIFFTRTSETIEEIGFSSVCLNSIPNAVFAGFLIRFRPIPNIIEPKFSKFFFRAICHRNYFVKEMNLVTRASLSQNLLKSMPVLLPPLSEQQEIADFLDMKCSEIDSLIELKQQKIEELKDYKKSIIYEYVTGKKSVI